MRSSTRTRLRGFLFFEGQEGRTLEHVNFLSMLGEAPAPLREAVLDVQDRLFTVDAGGTPETYHLAKRHFELHGKTHTLLMVKHLTRELRRQELDIWKKLIRVVGHELNNSLAPISSLVHSARLMLSSDETGKFERVFSTIEERARHLQDFVESYARFARLPNPRRERVDFGEFLASHRKPSRPRPASSGRPQARPAISIAPNWNRSSSTCSRTPARPADPWMPSRSRSRPPRTGPARSWSPTGGPA